MEMQKIDVKETLKGILNGSKDNSVEDISSILISLEQELKDEPIKYPPEDDLDLMIYTAQEDTMFSYADPQENTPEKLISFIKLQKEMQQKVLYRAYYVYRRLYAVTQRSRRFPLVFVD